MSSFVVSPNSTSVFTRQVLKLTGTGTTWLSTPPVLSVSFVSGCTITLNAVISDTVAFATLTTGAYGTPGNSPARINDATAGTFAGIAINTVASGTPVFADVDDVFLSGNIGAGGAGSTVTGGIDVTGGAWAVVSSKLRGTKSNGNLTSDPWLFRGIGTTLNHCVSQTFIGTDNSDGYITAELRKQPAGGPGCVAVLHNTTSGSPTLNIYHQKEDGTFLTGPAIFTSGVTNMNTGHTYRFESYATGIPMRLYFKIFDETAGTTLYDSSASPYPSESWGEITGYFDAPGTCGPTIRFIGVTLTHAKSMMAPDWVNQPVISRTSFGASTVGLTATAPTPATGSVSYQWYASATPGFVPGGGNILSGKTTQSVTITPPDGNIWYYKVVSTDSASTPNVVVSQDFGARLWRDTLVLGFIGDSMEQIVPTGGFRDFADAIAQHMGQLLSHERHVTVVNESVASTTTANWGTGGANYIAAKAAFVAQSATHIVVMLGSNDCAFGVSQVDYQAVIDAMVADLVGAGFQVILIPPPYRYLQPGPINGQASLLLSYATAMQTVAGIYGSKVISADMFNYSAQVNETLDGLHPNAAGVESFGWYAARDILNVLVAGSSGGTRLPQTQMRMGL